MTNFLSSLTFEWRYFVRQPSFIIMSMIFFLLAFLATCIEQVQVGSSANQSLNLNSPYLITQMLLIFSIFGLFLIVNFVANTALRARLSNMYELIYTKQTPRSYFLGSFFGSYLTVLSVFAFVPLGVFIGGLMPWLSPDRLGDNNVGTYLHPFAIYVIPSLFAMCCLIYAAALKFRSMMAVYLTALVVVIIYLTLDNLLSNPDYGTLVAILDPFALNSFASETRYWTPFERNTEISGMSLEMLANRLLWCGIGGAALYTCQFKWARQEINAQPEVKKRKSTGYTPVLRWHSDAAQGQNRFQQYLMRVFFETRLLVYSPSFIILLLFCAYLLIYQLVFPVSFFGAPNLPVTYEMVRKISESFGLFMLIIITFYSAEIVWREHNHKFQELLAVTSTPNEVFWFAKLTALCLLGALVYLMGMLITITHQLISGFYFIDLKQYLVSLFFFDALPLLYMTVLSFFIQSVSANKYIGMLLFIVFMILATFAGELGVEHHMYRYAESPNLIYSDMNGYAWSLDTQQKYMLYWGALALLFATISFGLWRRGSQTTLKHRFNILAQTLGNGGRLLVVCCLVVFLSLAIVIKYNTTVTNEFVSTSALESKMAHYEKTYEAFINKPVPDIIDADINIAMFPSHRKLQLIGNFTFKNNTDKPIERMLINLPEHSHSISFHSQEGKATAADTELQTAWFVFERPLLPNQTFRLKVDLMRQHFGFKDAGHDYGVVKNGSFLNNRELLPTFGVDDGFLLKDSAKRQDFGLADSVQHNDSEHYAARSRSFITKDSSVTDLSIYVSTEIDQVALAPGAMVDYWQANNRNHFIYRAEVPVLNFFNVMSADWQVHAKRFSGLDLSVHYHASHHWNIDNIMRAMESSLTAFSRRFGKYPFSQLRVVEFPRYRRFAQSFAGMISFSEGYGFIADLSDENKVDTVFFVTAHEVAHQWFGHLLNIADTEGAEVLTESLAQYAALSLMQSTHGRVNLRNFMRYELDNYLRGRAVEVEQENPLVNSHDQRYLSYNKGAIVMMSIAQRIGFDNVDRALNDLLADFSLESNNYATVQDLVVRLKKYADDSVHHFIDDQFSSIVLYDIRLEEVVINPLDDDQYQLELTIFAEQFRVTDIGAAQSMAFDNEVDIVLFADTPDEFDVANEILLTQTVSLKNGIQQIVVHTDKLPKFVSVDPFIGYIDREATDNVKAVH